MRRDRRREKESRKRRDFKVRKTAQCWQRERGRAMSQSGSMYLARIIMFPRSKRSDVRDCAKPRLSNDIDAKEREKPVTFAISTFLCIPAWSSVSRAGGSSEPLRAAVVLFRGCPFFPLSFLLSSLDSSIAS